MTTTLLANQKQLADLTNKFDGRTPVRVHFLDNSSKVFLLAEYTSVKDFLTMILEKLQLHDVSEILPYFALFESRNGSTIDNHIAMDAIVTEVIRSWQEAKVDRTAKFLFMIRLYLPCLWGLTFQDVLAHHLHRDKTELALTEYFDYAEIVDEGLIQLQFMQAIYHVITGKYPTTAEQALELGALHFLAKFGAYRPASHVAGFLGNRIAEFIPLKHLKGGSKGKGWSLEQWETELFKTVEKIMDDIDVQASRVDGIEILYRRKAFSTPVSSSNGQDSHRLVTVPRSYLEIVYGMNAIYGVTFFKATQKNARELPDTIIIGVYHEGLYLLDKQKALLKTYHIEDILRWGFKPNQSFFFEIPPELNDVGSAVLEFETTEGKVISDLLTDYAMAFLKEKEREEQRMASNYSAFPALDNLPTPPPVPGAPANGNGVRDGIPPPPKKNGLSASQLLDPRYRAAVRIQALWRGYSLRNEWAREDAAILIQAIFRGYKARVLLSTIIEQMIKDGEL